MNGRSELSVFELFDFDWDAGNDEKNLLKHTVTIKECEDVFYNIPLLVYEDTKHLQNERRLAAFGITDTGRKLHIIFTIRNRKIRVISARDQNKRERRFYEKSQKNTNI